MLVFSSIRHATSGRPGGRGRVLLLLAAPFVAIIVLSSTTPDVDREDVGVDDARGRWDDAGITEYRVTYTYGGLGEATASVADGVVIDYRTDEPRLEDATIHRVDSLFDAVAAVEDDPNGDVTSVEFDPVLGHPVRATLDPDRSVDGDEWSFEVLELVPG